ncbi:MAG: DNA mismatch repair protein MutT [Oceanicaulis sp.]|uniref:NUDIX domain-containing protein n=1 Tax=unclassified Oceanicaulis TaxID=2632123 RepID=UPI000C5F2B8F|nr:MULTISPECIES: NUDIX hydrolase [unclassified Oceanicaulis]MAB68837.1 DNA mismatch repair protein MutT [Oceanicaulis sp.]MBC39296.1 DNA mismatch repair protein MutT [Oceanicaulis sp.]MBG35219.1 DNA mismatch repair protein MutT [Oceanicaulis sp.]HBU62468.1 DNA mismatch repair protein MutT [Oceanicaulis sp.]HCR94394.1 DNA mismatch repair protein MutT [Oceanicaulis sp.]
MTQLRRGPWTILSERLGYENPWMRVREFDVLRPDGQPGLYGVMEPRQAAIGVLPVYDNGDTVLVGQHRFALDAWSWELPEGGGPEGVAPLESAKRELEEETGLRAAHWRPLSEFDVSNSITSERAYSFIAWGLSEGTPEREGTEADMQMRRLPLREALEMAISGTIRDGFSMIMLMAAVEQARRGALDPGLSRSILSGLDEA